MGETAVAIGANTFQFFTRNPRGGTAKSLNVEDIEAYLQYAEENKLQPILAHAPYTLNCCAASEKLRAFAQEIMTDDLYRLEHLPGSMYNFHPGNHVGQGVETGIHYIAHTLNTVLQPQQSTVILLETMSGKGTEIGRTFEELRRIINEVQIQSRIGICLDTCHIYDGGYDITSNLDFVLDEFDTIIGLNYLRAVHLNDSMNSVGSHKDRHQNIGKGSIGIGTFQKIMTHPSLCNLPFYLETPNTIDGYAQEIALVKKLYYK